MDISSVASLRASAHGAINFQGRQVPLKASGDVHVVSGSTVTAAAGTTSRLRADGALLVSSSNTVAVEAHSAVRLLGGEISLLGGEIRVASSSTVGLAAAELRLTAGGILAVNSDDHRQIAAAELYLLAGSARLQSAARIHVVATAVTATSANAMHVFGGSHVRASAGSSIRVSGTHHARISTLDSVALRAPSMLMRSVSGDADVIASSSVQLQSKFGTSAVSGMTGVTITGREVTLQSERTLALNTARTASARVQGESEARIVASGGHTIAHGPEEIAVAGQTISVSARGNLDIVSPADLHVTNQHDAS
jgi:hypothetical protein